MTSSLWWSVLSLNFLPLFCRKREFTEIIQCIHPIWTTKNIQILWVTDHRAVRPALRFLVSTSGLVNFFPCEILKIQCINIVHEFGLRWNVTSINVHFLVEDSAAVRIDSWQYDVGLDLAPRIFGNWVNESCVTAFGGSFFTSKKDNFVAISHCSVVFQSDLFAVAYVIQFHPKVIIFAILLGKINLMEIT